MSTQTTHHRKTTVLGYVPKPAMAEAVSQEDDVTKRRRINREAAARARQRQKDTAADLKQKVLQLESEKTALNYENRMLEKQVKNLQDAIKYHLTTCQIPGALPNCLATGTPDPPPPPPQGATTNAATLTNQSMTVANGRLVAVNGQSSMTNGTGVTVASIKARGGVTNLLPAITTLTSSSQSARSRQGGATGNGGLGEKAVLSLETPSSAASGSGLVRKRRVMPPLDPREGGDAAGEDASQPQQHRQPLLAFVMDGNQPAKRPRMPPSSSTATPPRTHVYAVAKKQRDLSASGVGNNSPVFTHGVQHNGNHFGSNNQPAFVPASSLNFINLKTPATSNPAMTLVSAAQSLPVGNARQFPPMVNRELPTTVMEDFGEENSFSDNGEKEVPFGSL